MLEGSALDSGQQNNHNLCKLHDFTVMTTLETPFAFLVLAGHSRYRSAAATGSEFTFSSSMP
jgi:hypothetical protein